MTERFTYIRAHTLAEGVDLLAENGVRSRVLAGGTDLMVEIRRAHPTFDRLVDVSRIPELRVIEYDGRMTVGAAVTIAELLTHPAVVEKVSLLAAACAQIGSVQIRNVATIGGNVASAAPCADTLPVLVCLNAEAFLVSVQGERSLPVQDLVLGPHRTCLAPGEMIRAFSFLPPPPSSRQAFLRIGRRQAMSISRLSLAGIGAKGHKGEVTDIRLCTGSAFARFHREGRVEAMMLGQLANEKLFVRAGRELARLFEAESGSRWSAPYKREVLPALTERTLRRIFGDQP